MVSRREMLAIAGLAGAGGLPRLAPAASWPCLMTWHSQWITDPALNPPDDLRRFYHSPRIVTRDDLPHLKGA